MPADLTAWHLGTIVAATALGSLPALAIGRRPTSVRLAIFVTPPLLVAVGWMWATTISIRPVLSSWSGARLAPIASWWRGYSLYPLADEGPVTGWIYPPLSALAYLPAVIVDEPVTALLIGRGLSLLFFYGPVAALLAIEAVRVRMPPSLVAVLFALFACLAQASRPLRYVSTEILADAPALGLMAGSMLCVGRMASGQPRLWGTLAVVTAVLAAWSKQLEAALLVVPLAAAWLVGGRRVALWLAMVAAGVAAGVAALFAAAFGPRNLLFQLGEIPRRHPFRERRWGPAVDLIGQGLADDRLMLGLLGLGLATFVLLAFWKKGGVGPATGWVPFLAAAALEAPFALLGFLKLGGDANSLAHALYPAATASVLLLGQIGRLAPRAGFMVLLLAVGLMVPRQWQVGVLLADRSPPWNDELGRGMNWKDEERALAEAVRARPGLYYFPTYPLTALLIEGRLGHFEYGVFDRDLAGMPVAEEELRRGIPPSVRFLCYPGGRTFTLPDHFLRRALPEFHRPVRLAELPFCECYARDAAIASPSQVTPRSLSTTSPITQEGTPASSVR